MSIFEDILRFRDLKKRHDMVTAAKTDDSYLSNSFYQTLMAPGDEEELKNFPSYFQKKVEAIADYEKINIPFRDDPAYSKSTLNDQHYYDNANPLELTCHIGPDAIELTRSLLSITKNPQEILSVKKRMSTIEDDNEADLLARATWASAQPDTHLKKMPAR